MRSFHYLTWLDVKRAVREQTAFGSRLPEGITQIRVYSDAMEVGVVEEAHRHLADQALRQWFGDWYQSVPPAVRLDLGDSVLPVEFVVGEEKSDMDISVRPFWEEVVYIRPESDTEENEDIYANLPEPFPDGSPEVVAFYSFKGGVGRSLHLAAYLFALLERAKEMDTRVTVLVIDADLEAPGLTWWNLQEKQLATVSFLDFLEVIHYSPWDDDSTLNWFARELKKTVRTDGKSQWLFLPAFINEKHLLDTPVLPEHIARNTAGGWGCGDAIVRLGNILNADYVLIDLRAGLSEMSSPLLFDPRIQRLIVSTIAEQSIRGTCMVMDMLKRVALRNPENEAGEGPYSDPALILSMLKPEYKALSSFEDALVALRQAYVETGDDNVYSRRLQIFETDFNEELLAINNWEDGKARLKATSIQELARNWAKGRLIQTEAAGETSVENEIFRDVAFEQLHRLRGICQEYEFAENGRAKKMLVTDSLKNLATSFRENLPQVVCIGAKGSGKTFNYIQLSQFGTWGDFLGHVLKESMPEDVETYIYPLLQSRHLKDDARRIIEETRNQLEKAFSYSFPTYSASDSQDRIAAKLQDGNAAELDWAMFWIEEIAISIGIDVAGEKLNRMGHLNDQLKTENIRIIFLIDGLEDIFTNISTCTVQQTALRALIDVPRRLTEIRQAVFGIIIFVRRDIIRHAMPYNMAQFENLYRAYDLTWNEDSFRQLVFWICSQSGVIDAKEEEIDVLNRGDLDVRLERLWGMKLGTDNSKEANSRNWVFAALTDFLGRLQARDIVRFLLYASEIAYQNPNEVAFDRWFSSRLLPPQAIRRAIKPCSSKKVDEFGEEYPDFRAWVEKIRTISVRNRKIPFTADELQMAPATIKILKEIGVIYEDRGRDDVSRFYMPEIFRAGLDFSLEKGARPRVLVLKRKALEM